MLQQDRLRRPAWRTLVYRRAVSAHRLRHAHTSHALDRDAPITWCKPHSAGHSSVATAGRYLHAPASRPACQSQSLGCAGVAHSGRDQSRRYLEPLDCIRQHLGYIPVAQFWCFISKRALRCEASILAQICDRSPMLIVMARFCSAREYTQSRNSR